MQVYEGDNCHDFGDKHLFYILFDELCVTNRKVRHKLHLSRIMRKLLVLIYLESFVILKRIYMTSQAGHNLEWSDF